MLWGSFAYLILQPAYRAPGGLQDTFAGLAPGEPGWVAAMDRGVASAAGPRGLAICIGLAVVFVAAGFGVFWPVTARAALILSALAGVAIWVLGENFGALLTGQGTDPSSGLLLAALAAAFWPLSRRPAAAVPLVRAGRGSWSRRNPANRRTGRPGAAQLVELGRPTGSRTRPSMAAMTTVPDRARVRLPGISSRAYEHPADRSALVAMRKLTGFDVLLKRLASLFSDRSLRLLFMASSVRASNEQFPDLYRLLLDGAAILDLPEVPELYISQDPMPNAMTLGSDKPFIVITTGLVDLMDAEENRWVIGHELGHVLSGHAVYRTMLYHLTRLATRLAWFAIGYIGLRVIIAGLEEWYRKSELSCDRAGVLASQDPAAARRSLMKLAGGSRISELSPDAFLEQAREYDAVPDVREGLLKMLQMQGTTHPFAVVRFAELDRWVAEGEYEDILAGTYPRREDDRDAKIGDEFVAAARAYQESWSRSEDPFIGLVKGVAETTVGAGERIFEGIFGRRGGGTGSGSGGNG